MKTCMHAAVGRLVVGCPGSCRAGGRAGSAPRRQPAAAAGGRHPGHAFQRADGDRAGEPRGAGGHGAVFRQEHGQRLRGQEPRGRLEPRVGARRGRRQHHPSPREGDREDHRQLRRGHQRLHLDRHDDVLHRLSGEEHDDGHRAVGRRDAAREVRSDRVRPRDEGRPSRAGRRGGRASARAVEAAARDGLYDPSRPLPDHRLPRSAQPHDEPDDRRFLP